MKFAFRTDSSLEMGTGHVMRCLTLADVLREGGARCFFICRAHPGNLIQYIRRRGYQVVELPLAPVDLPETSMEARVVHSTWLGASQSEDARQCQVILKYEQPNWLVVDHYAIDQCWEVALQGSYGRLMVIDDLADRKHVCDLLLDQTFGRDVADYQSIVSENCQLLCGSEYALLRPEFAQWRPYSLRRRVDGEFRKLLISMGGVDKGNVTGRVLDALSDINLPGDFEITVVMGATAPWLGEVMQLANQMSGMTRVLVNATNMAELMANSDFAIGAAGATSWERCCLGVPTAMVLLAENQRKIASELSCAGAVVVLYDKQMLAESLSELCSSTINKVFLTSMSQRAALICDGTGAASVSSYLLGDVN